MNCTVVGKVNVYDNYTWSGEMDHDNWVVRVYNQENTK